MPRNILFQSKKSSETVESGDEEEEEEEEEVEEEKEEEEVSHLYTCNLFTHGTPKSSRNSFKGVCAFQFELEFEDVGFSGGKKTGVPGEKPSEPGREPTTNSTHI